MRETHRRKSRVLFLDHVAETGGAELLLLDIALRRGGPCEVLLFADGPFRSRLERAGIAVQVTAAGSALQAVRRTSSLLAALASGPGVARLALAVAVRARRFDVLFANSQKALVVSVIAAQLTRRPLIWYLHDILTASHFGGLNRALAPRLANVGAALVIVNSRATAKGFVDAGGRPAKVRVIYNGIDPVPIDAVDVREARARLRSELGCGSATKLVGAFSRLAAWKGQHVLIDALGRLPKDVHAVIVGDALFDEQAYALELRQRAQAGGIAGRVHFLGFREDVPALMKAVDIVAHTSVAPEPFGRVIVEGMLARRPVVASAAGGALEIIGDGEHGLLVPPGDPAALARAVNGLLAAPDRAAMLAQRGRERALAHFSLDACVAAVEDVLEEVVRRRHC